MGATGHFVHRIKKTVDQTFTNTYATDKSVLVNLNAADDIKPNSPTRIRPFYSGNIQLIRLKGTIANGATQIQLQGYEDASGQNLLLPSSTGTLEAGVSGSDFSVVFKVDIFHASQDDSLYLFCKTNTGTFTVSEVQVAWYE
tara:strand:- start:80 stop:505 length:426 start_codon:yes stop_codon:yes gene_type:complete